MSFEVTREDIEETWRRIAGHVRRTPVLELGRELGDFDLILKLEHLQVTGSFKARGAFSIMTGVDIPDAGVVAASGGNFGAAVAHAANVLGLQATVFVPETSPLAKIDRIRRHGADVRVISGFYDQAREASERHAAETGAYQAHAYDQPEVVAGQGTIAMEIADQAEPDIVLVAVGGGGLIAGVSSWFGDDVSLVAVEPERCSCFNSALAAGNPVDVEVSGVAVSSLGARRVGDHCWAARDRIDRSVLVDDDAIVDAQRWLWAETRLVVEPAAASSLAALRSGAVLPEPGARVVALLSGANLDPATVG